VLVRRLGTGGFGEVWQVRHPREKSLVAAVKFCVGQSARRLLEHEAKVIGQVMKLGSSVPGIVPLLDFNVHADPPWLKYELVPGGDLLAHAASCFGTAATGVIQVLSEIVGQFHRLSPPVVHRDLKPANILVSRGAKRELRFRIADFGIGGTASSWALDHEGRHTLPSAALPTVLIGSHTPLYASPQQKQGARADPRDDVFALGVLWYQLLIGNLVSERPGGNWRRRLAHLRLSEGLLDLLGDCSSDDPDERPADAASLAEAITHCRKTAQEVEPDTRVAAVPLQAPRLPLATQLRTSVPLVNSLGMRFVLVPSGTFWMGGGGGQAGTRQVAVERDFYLGAVPVTQGQWQSLLGQSPSWFSRTGGGRDMVCDISGPDLADFPVENVSWHDAQLLIHRLNEINTDPEWAYRLPTEEEWELACRGGAISPEECSYHFYLDELSDILSSTQANFDGNHPFGASLGPCLGRTCKVGSYPPNRLGIHDMHGNVWEWCDTAEGTVRVLRGGSWGSHGTYCRAAIRSRLAASDRSYNRGLRLARVPSA
jgi:formylglycine-generating enzyme required for sulfatase activity